MSKKQQLDDFDFDFDPQSRIETGKRIRNATETEKTGEGLRYVKLTTGLVAGILAGKFLYHWENIKETPNLKIQSQPELVKKDTQSTSDIKIDFPTPNNKIVQVKSKTQMPVSTDHDIIKEASQKPIKVKKQEKTKWDNANQSDIDAVKSPEAKTKKTSIIKSKSKPKNKLNKPTKSNFVEFFASKDIPAKKVQDIYDFYKKSGAGISDKEIFEMMPLLIVESQLKWEQKGTYVGYGQLSALTEEDLHTFIPKSRKYQRLNKRWNAVLSYFYYKKRLPQMLDSHPDIKWNYDQKLITMAYNGGAKNLKSLMRTYQKEKWNKKVYYTSFLKWLTKKVDPKARAKMEFDKAYNVEKRNWFSKNLHSSSKQVIIWGKKFSYREIYEMVNYIEKYEAIKNTNQWENGENYLAKR